MRRLVLRLHLVVAAGAGIFLLILGATGAVMAFETEIGHALHPSRWYVTPGPGVLPLTTLGEAASRAVPGATPGAYVLSTAPNLSYQVSMRGRVVYVNQYTGDVLDVVPNGPDVLSRIHQLHLRLLWSSPGDPGKLIMTWAGVAILFLALSGLYLWWPVKRWRLRRGGRAARTWLDLHHVVGIASFVFLLTAGVTGVAIGFESATVPLAYRVTGTAPQLMYGNAPSFHSSADGRPMIAPDAALDAARAALPGAAPVLVNVPGPTSVYAISMRYPEDLTPGGRSRVVIDPYSGAVLAAEGSRSAPAGTRLITLNRAVHTGDVLGVPSKIVMSLASLAAVVQAISGLAIWWTRRARATPV